MPRVGCAVWFLLALTAVGSVLMYVTVDGLMAALTLGLGGAITTYVLFARGETGGS